MQPYVTAQIFHNLTHIINVKSTNNSKNSDEKIKAIKVVSIIVNNTTPF